MTTNFNCITRDNISKIIKNLNGAVSTLNNHQKDTKQIVALTKKIA